MDEYIGFTRNPAVRICAYLPVRGEHKHTICAALVTDQPDVKDRTELRCPACRIDGWGVMEGKKADVIKQIHASCAVIHKI
jgi:hypothetical protein